MGVDDRSHVDHGPGGLHTLPEAFDPRLGRFLLEHRPGGADRRLIRVVVPPHQQTRQPRLVPLRQADGHLQPGSGMGEVVEVHEKICQTH